MRFFKNNGREGAKLWKLSVASVDGKGKEGGGEREFSKNTSFKNLLLILNIFKDKNDFIIRKFDNSIIHVFTILFKPVSQSS